MKKLYYFLLVFISVAACKNDDDDVPSRTIFEFTGRTWNSTPEDWWIILHDNESGDFIDSKQVFPNQTTTFESTKKIPSGKLMVTFFRAATNSTGGGFADIHRDIELGDKWAYGNRTITIDHQNNIGGEYDLEITNVPSLFNVEVSDGYGENEFTTDTEVNEDGVVSMSPYTSDSPNKQLITLETVEDHPKYYMIDQDIEANDEVTIDYADFKDFDKYVTVTVPEGDVLNEAYITGGYIHPLAVYIGYTFENYSYNFESASPKKPEISVGFLNSIPSYFIRLRTGNWIYTSQGNPPSSIEFASGDGYTSSGTNFDDFKITTTKNYVYSQSLFGYGGSVVLTYFASKGNEKAVYTLTSDIEEKYKLDKSKMEYRGTYYNVAGRSLSDYVNFTYDDDYDFKTTYFESIVGGARQ